MENNTPKLKEKTIQEGDLYSHVCGQKEPRGHVRVLGKGPTPQDVGTPGAYSIIPTRLQLEIEAHRQTKQEFITLTQRMDQMQQRFDLMEQVVQSQGVQNMETSSHHASNSRHIESPRIEGPELCNSNQQENHGEPSTRHVESMPLDENDSIIRRKVVAPSVPSKSNAAIRRGHEASSGEEENLVGRDVILYAVLRSDIPVAKATIVSTNPSTLVGDEPLGVQFYEVVVNVVLKRDALLPRPYDGMETMADAQYTSIAWPHHRMNVSRQRPATSKSLGSTQ